MPLGSHYYEKRNCNCEIFSRIEETFSHNYEIKWTGTILIGSQWQMALPQLRYYYHLLGLRHWEILAFLKPEDSINICTTFGLYRRRQRKTEKEDRHAGCGFISAGATESGCCMDINSCIWNASKRIDLESMCFHWRIDAEARYFLVIMRS